MRWQFFKKNKFILLILFVIVVCYLPLFKGFYQQDEWQAFGSGYLNQSLPFINRIANFFYPKIGHYTPLRDLVFDFLFGIFKVNYFPWALVSIIFHIIITCLVYLLARELSNSEKYSLIVAFIFGISASGIQATTWVVTDLNTHGAVIFAIFSFIFFIKSFSSENKKDLLVSVFFLFASLLFKEISIGMFIVYLFYLFFSNKKQYKIYVFKFIFISFLIYSIFRVFALFLPHQATNDKQIVTQTQSTQTLILNMLTSPFKVVPQLILSSNGLIYFSNKITSLIPNKITGGIGTTSFDRYSENVISVSLVIVINFIFYLIFKTRYCETSDKNNKLILMIGLVFIVLNSFIYSLSPGVYGFSVYFDSRNLYFLNIGMAMILPIIFSKGKVLNIFLILFFVFNLFLTQNYFNMLNSDAKKRIEILRKASLIIPDNQNDFILYSESDKSYYGLAEKDKILPFQSGFGHTFMVYNQSRLNLSGKFFDNYYLWDIESQDYKEIDGKSFGYYRVFDDLAKMVKNKNIDMNFIYSFRYDSQLNEVFDTTSEIRGRLKGYLSNERKIKNYIVTSTLNKVNIKFLSDAKRETFWDSQLPYSNYQYLDIDFKDKMAIAHIQIDSYNNSNQDKVGYRISLSNDKINWKEVYYSKAIQPDTSGIINIYMKPEKYRYLRIEQIGTHNFASWVINELNIYEAKD